MRRVSSTALLMVAVVGCGGSETTTGGLPPGVKEGAANVIDADATPPAGGGGAKEDRRSDLSGLGMAYHRHHEVKGEGPKTADDLAGLITDEAERADFEKSTAYQRLKAGDFVINPGLKFRELKDLSKIALLFEKAAPEAGGIVVLGDGSVVELTKDQFAALDSPASN